MTKQDITVQTGALPHVKSIKISGYVDPTFAGLAIHRGLARDGNGGFDTRGPFTITHIASGLRVAGGFPNRKAAAATATELAGVAVWTTTAKQLLRQRKRLGERIRAVISKHGGGR